MSGGTEIGYEVNELELCFLKKIQKKGFCVSLLNRLIQDNSDHHASKRSKDPKNPRPEWILLLTHQDPSDLELICFHVVKKLAQNLFSDYFGFKNPILDFLKETHPKST